MLLKKLSISGFKSFAERAEFHFSHNISGIVGPNGSGKSNLIDAVRWVMGEQSAKQLRGERATDVIFAGSERRKPLGMAEVKLTFDNSQGTLNIPQLAHEQEINLTRRIYLDGHKEHAINKSPCRLKDIIEFFALSELGSKSYSMIQQGQVDRILNAKPEDIRELIEEAAGTIVFRKKKTETENKLASALQNLQRVEDILRELSKQKEKLEEQVQQAKKWQKLSDKHAQLDQHILAHRFQQTKNKLHVLLEEIRSENKHEIANYNELKKLQNKRNTLQKQFADTEPQTQQIERELGQLQKSKQELETTLIKLKIQKENSQQRVEELAASITEAEMEAEQNEQELQKQQQAHAALNKQTNALAVKLATTAQQVEHLDQQAANIVSKQEEHQEEIEHLGKIRDEALVAIKLLQRTQERLSQEQQTLQQQYTEVADKLQLSVTQKEKLKQTMLAQERDFGTKAEKKLTLEKKNTDLQIKRIEDEQQRDAAKERYFQHKANYESISASASASSALVSVADMPVRVLADYLSFLPKISELPSKIVNAFETWSEQLLVADYATYLRFCAAGKVRGQMSVFVAEALPALDTSALALWKQKYEVTPMLQFLQVEETARPLCARIYVCLDLIIEANLLREMPVSLLLFTAQGAWIGADGNARLVNKSGEGIISQQQKLKILAKALQEARTHLASLQLQIDRAAEKQTNNCLEIEAFNEELATDNKDLEKIVSGYRAVLQRTEHLQGVLAELQTKKQEQEEEINKNQTELQQQEEERNGIQQELQQLRADFSDIKSSYRRYQQQQAAKAKSLQTLQMEKVKLNAKLDTIARELHHTNKQNTAVRSRLLHNYDERNRYEKEGEQADLDEQRYRHAVENLLRAQEQKNQHLQHKKGNMQMLIQELKKTESAQNKQQRDHALLQKNIVMKTARKEQLEISLQTVKEQATTYQGFALEESEVQEKLNILSLEQQKQELKNQLAQMGAVNMLALDEYEKLVARKEFIDEQKQELLDSIEFLRQASDEIEKKATSRFQEIFTKVSEEFSGLFPTLFPRGKAHLVLNKPDTPLASGVQIMVQLHGKKQQQMNLFSGGEKSLTAIALIFSLLKTKPTPFCFLDEVDAALDEVNITRFNRILRDLSLQFQFILITHNRKTMEIFNHLYGVTMQEPGVSKVVSVDMRKDLAMPVEQPALH